MSSFDHVRIGELRIRADRAEARAERYDQISRQLEPLLRDMGTPSAVRFADELLAASVWDGCPKADGGVPMTHRSTRGGIT